MTVWLDAQLSPAIAPWISVQFSVAAVAVRDLGLRDSTDREISLRQDRRWPSS
jgi:predicted nuclease of predicted toxin-antitoxin system